MTRPWKSSTAVCLSAALAVASVSAAELQRAEEIVQGKCFICHGAEGESSSPVFPRLAGQHAQYTERQLKAFNQCERSNDNAVMHSVAVKLTEQELKAVSSFISGLR